MIPFRSRLRYTGLYDVSASSPHSGFVNWILSTTSHASVQRRASEIEVPPVDSEALVLAGANDYNSMCSSCHGVPGTSPEAVGRGLNPPPPDLAEEAAAMSPAELFWLTKNGIKMTGMPAWGATHDDDAIWPVVAFMTKLPGLDESAYQTLLAEAEGVGHHADDAAHGHEDADDHEYGESMRPQTSPEMTDKDDHSTHDHNSHEH